MNALEQTIPKGFPNVAVWRREAGATLKLAIPLVLTELGFMAIITTDIVMMGWLGPSFLAAGSLGGYFFVFFQIFAFGILAAVAAILAQHLGARRFRQVRPTLRHGAWLAVLLASLCGLVIWHGGPILVLLGQEPALAQDAQTYLRVLLVGFLPTLWLFILAELLAAHQRPRATLAVTVVGIGLNALIDYALMFGHFGLPRLELIGAGIASASVNSFMFAALLGFVLFDRRLRRYRFFAGWWKLEWARFLEILRLGLPIAVAEVAEMGMFLATALLIGLLGAVPLAANAIAVQCVALFFVVPIGLAQAATVRVGRACGAGLPEAARRAGWIAIALGVSFALVPASLFWLAGSGIVGLFLDRTDAGNRPVIELAVAFLAIAALFQLVDAAQIVARGALRGLKDTRGPMLIAVVGYWGLGLPAAALFGIHFELGGEAIWGALALALTVVSGLLLWRFRVQSGRLLRRGETRTGCSGEKGKVCA